MAAPQATFKSFMCNKKKIKITVTYKNTPVTYSNISTKVLSLRPQEIYAKSMAGFSCSPVLKIFPALLREHIPCEHTLTVCFIGKVQENWPNLQ